eukprot:CAMPEP_0194591818 /NCGR_PEP_ID=MMETSP0292-20121207/22333_1 /TAXON_ID=39354 /ORGANISM="Heterosigma akashiwo, Strain CCMP2393" /LENGTH=127 /DNA_ID=CAMNT_0039450047 /DNA_START=151 /DNA_END=530 /DNA_ORIENTATION=+
MTPHLYYSQLLLRPPLRESQGCFPTWLLLGLVLGSLLIGGGGGAVWRRRRGLAAGAAPPPPPPWARRRPRPTTAACAPELRSRPGTRPGCRRPGRRPPPIRPEQRLDADQGSPALNQELAGTGAPAA